MLSFSSMAEALELDNSFGTGGKVSTNIGGVDNATRVIVQDNGKILVAGISDNNWTLARYNSNGTLDTSFDGDGKVTTDLGSTDVAWFVGIQDDGKIVLAGVSGTDFALARYDSTGTLDGDFGTGGLVTTDFHPNPFFTSNDYGLTGAIQSDGKILVAGESDYNGDQDFALARYNSDGTLDLEFGDDDDGLVATDFGGSIDSASSIVIQNGGKIVLAGVSGTDFALARYNIDGSLDTSFDGDGKVTTEFGQPDDRGWQVAIQNDGKIVLAGVSGTDFALARYNSDGTLDTSFDIDGKVTTSFGEPTNDYSYSVAIQSDGKILVAGYSDGDFALARYNIDGSLDTSFDGDGKVTTVIAGTESANSIAIQEDGKILLAGILSPDVGGDGGDFFLVRYGIAPAFTLSSTSESKTVNSLISGYTISSTGGTITSYSISPAAPAGLTFNTSTGLLTGSPSVVAGATTYTITGINEIASTTRTFTLTVTAASTATDNSATLAAAAAEAARRAKEQKELTEILSIIPKIGELSLGLGEITKTLTFKKCVKSTTIKFVKKGSKCPKGFVRAK